MRPLVTDRSPLRALVPFCLALLLMAVASPASQVLRYREQTGDHSFTFSWRADREGDGTTITVVQHQGDEVFTSRNSQEGATQAWRYVKEPDTDVRVERRGDSLRFEGRFDGEPVDQTRTIDHRPWFQPLSFSLNRMVAGDQRAASFWTIRPDTLDVLTLQAEQGEIESVTVADGTTRQARKVVVRLEGLMASFWRAEYWFGQDDHLFLQYRSTHGPPGTAETRISLLGP